MMERVPYSGWVPGQKTDQVPYCAFGRQAGANSVRDIQSLGPGGILDGRR